MERLREEAKKQAKKQEKFSKKCCKELVHVVNVKDYEEQEGIEISEEEGDTARNNCDTKEGNMAYATFVMIIQGLIQELMVAVAIHWACWAQPGRPNAAGGSAIGAGAKPWKICVVHFCTGLKCFIFHALWDSMSLVLKNIFLFLQKSLLL